MTDLLIVNSSSEDYDKSETSYPLGVCYLAASAEAAGYQVAFFESYKERWTAAAKRFEECVRGLRPAIIGFSCLSFNRNSMRDAARISKEILPECVTICGGAHATPMHEQILKHYDMDIVVRGEGEITLNEIIAALINNAPLDNIAGIAFKDNGEIHATAHREFIQDLDGIPFPKHDLYSGKIREERKAYIITTRGCSGRCHFCASTHQLGSKYRMRSAQNVLDEIIELYGTYKINFIGFMDDALTLNQRRTREFCEGLAALNLPITWSASTRVNAFNEETAALMYSAGCRHIAFGVESGSEKLLKAMNKKINTGQVVEAFRIAHNTGFSTGVLLIAGTPGENWDSVRETVRLVKRLRPAVVKSVAILQIFPGTHWYDYCKEKGYLTDDYWLSRNLVPYFTFEHSELKLSLFGFIIAFASRWYASPVRGIGFFFSSLYTYMPRILRAFSKLIFKRQ